MNEVQPMLARFEKLIKFTAVIIITPLMARVIAILIGKLPHSSGAYGLGDFFYAYIASLILKAISVICVILFIIAVIKVIKLNSKITSSTSDPQSALPPESMKKHKTVFTIYIVVVSIVSILALGNIAAYSWVKYSKEGKQQRQERINESVAQQQEEDRLQAETSLIDTLKRMKQDKILDSFMPIAQKDNTGACIGATFGSVFNPDFNALQQPKDASEKEKMNAMVKEFKDFFQGGLSVLGGECYSNKEHYAVQLTNLFDPKNTRTYCIDDSNPEVVILSSPITGPSCSNVDSQKTFKNRSDEELSRHVTSVLNSFRDYVQATQAALDGFGNLNQGSCSNPTLGSIFNPGTDRKSFKTKTNVPDHGIESALSELNSAANMYVKETHPVEDMSNAQCYSSESQWAYQVPVVEKGQQVYYCADNLRGIVRSDKKITGPSCVGA